MEKKTIFLIAVWIMFFAAVFISINSEGMTGAVVSEFIPQSVPIVGFIVLVIVVTSIVTIVLSFKQRKK